MAPPRKRKQLAQTHPHLGLRIWQACVEHGLSLAYEAPFYFRQRHDERRDSLECGVNPWARVTGPNDHVASCRVDPARQRDLEFFPIDVGLDDADAINPYRVVLVVQIDI